MKKVAMMVAAVALAVMMSGCFCTKAYAKVDKCGGAAKKGCCGRQEYRYVRPYCPACDKFTVHYGVCPTVTLYE